LDLLLAGRDPQELFAKDGLVDELKKAPSERILNTELDVGKSVAKATPTAATAARRRRF
jgi:putative transposase